MKQRKFISTITAAILTVNLLFPANILAVTRSRTANLTEQEKTATIERETVRRSRKNSETPVRKRRSLELPEIGLGPNLNAASSSYYAEDERKSTCYICFNVMDQYNDNVSEAIISYSIGTTSGTTQAGRTIEVQVNAYNSTYPTRGRGRISYLPPEYTMNGPNDWDTFSLNGHESYSTALNVYFSVNRKASDVRKDSEKEEEAEKKAEKAKLTEFQEKYQTLLKQDTWKLTDWEKIKQAQKDLKNLMDLKSIKNETAAIKQKLEEAEKQLQKLPITLNIDYVDKNSKDILTIAVVRHYGEKENFQISPELNRKLQEKNKYTLALLQTLPEHQVTLEDEQKHFKVGVKMVKAAGMISQEPSKISSLIKYVDDNGQMIKSEKQKLQFNAQLKLDIPQGYELKDKNKVYRQAAEVIVELVRREYLVSITYLGKDGHKIHQDEEKYKYNDEIKLKFLEDNKTKYKLQSEKKVILPKVKEAMQLKYTLIEILPWSDLSTNELKQSKEYQAYDEDGKLLFTGKAEKEGQSDYQIKLPPEYAGYEIINEDDWQKGKSDRLKLRLRRFKVVFNYVLNNSQCLAHQETSLKYGEKAVAALPAELQNLNMDKRIKFVIEEKFVPPIVKGEMEVVVPIKIVIEENAVNGSAKKTENQKTEEEKKEEKSEEKKDDKKDVKENSENKEKNKDNVQDKIPEKSEQGKSPVETTKVKKTVEQESTQATTTKNVPKLSFAENMQTKPGKNSSLLKFVRSDNKQALSKLPLSLLANDGKQPKFTIIKGDYYYEPNGELTSVYTDDNGELLLNNLPDGDYRFYYRGVELAKLHIDNSLADPGVEGVINVQAELLEKADNMKQLTEKLSQNIELYQNRNTDNLSAEEKLRSALAEYNRNLSPEQQVSWTEFTAYLQQKKQEELQNKYEVVKTAEGTFLKLKNGGSDSMFKAYRIARTGEKAGYKHRMFLPLIFSFGK